jgi:hypothetical protein
VATLEPVGIEHTDHPVLRAAAGITFPEQPRDAGHIRWHHAQ